MNLIAVQVCSKRRAGNGSTSSQIFVSSLCLISNPLWINTAKADIWNSFQLCTYVLWRFEIIRDCGILDSDIKEDRVYL